MDAAFLCLDLANVQLLLNSRGAFFLHTPGRGSARIETGGLPCARPRKERRGLFAALLLFRFFGLPSNVRRRSPGDKQNERIREGEGILYYDFALTENSSWHQLD